MSNFGLYKAFDALDIDYAKTAVGDKYVYEYMMQNGCRIGGEQSGHIIFSKYASTGDGILTSLKMMEVIMARKKKLSELTADLAIYPQVLENVRVHDKAAAQADVDVQAAVESVAEALGRHRKDPGERIRHRTPAPCYGRGRERGALQKICGSGG